MTLAVITLATPELGNRSYLVHDDTAAIVIDPPRDIDRIQTLLDTYGLRCAAVAETHIHNDYLTGEQNWAASAAVPIWSTPPTRCASTATASATVSS